ncbi:MAG: hypothetical protein Q8R04_02200 [Nanoarchaeota archaeon]|nr:hypothetical protein [Nanoarchaeota archaeon]
MIIESQTLEEAKKQADSELEQIQKDKKILKQKEAEILKKKFEHEFAENYIKNPPSQEELNKGFEKFGKEAKLGQDILNILEEQELNKKYLDLGFIESAEGHFWYYGFVARGKEAIITSNKKIYRNTEEIWKGQKTGINDIKQFFDYDGYIGGIAPLINREAIKRFLLSDLPLDKRKIFREVVDKIIYYMDFEEQESIAYVQACWILATHCYPLFYWFPHVLFHAPSESGKSKNAFILIQLSFRGFDLGAAAGVTPAQIFRTLEANRGTILLDEYEKLEKSETQQLVNQILNASATRDAYVIRTEQIDKKWRAWKFPIFCPKIACSISGINPTSQNRFIVFQLLKTNNVEKGKRKPYRQKDIESFIPLRDNNSILMLENWKEIRQIYESLNLDLINRDEDNWLPICAVAKWIGEDVFEKVLNYIENYKEIKIQSDDLTQTLFLVIYENVTTELKPYSPKEIATWLGDEVSIFKSPAHWIGRQLKKYQFKPVRHGSGMIYNLSKDNVKNIINRYFSTDKYTQTTTTTLNTLTTQNTLNSVVSVDSVVIPKVDVAQFLAITKEFSNLFNPNGEQVLQWLANARLSEQQAEEFIKEQLSKGNLFENPSGHYQVTE